VKDSNLQVYGDYDLLSLIEASVEEHRIEFCSEECKKRIEEFYERFSFSVSINGFHERFLTPETIY
jgi:hypothetical protein